MVNPPGNPKARFQAAAEPISGFPGPDDWQGAAKTVAGSWWPDYSAWLAERSGGEKKAPAKLGATGHPQLDPAPGRYVFDR